MQPDQELTDRFNRGECTPAEAKLVMEWMLENEEGAAPAKEWEESSPMGGYPVEYPVQMLTFIEQNKHIGSPDAGRMAPVRGLPWKGLAAAASVILAVCLSLILLNNGKGREAGSPVITFANAPARSDKAVMGMRIIAVNAPAGEHSTIHLTDGSTAILSPGTVLRYDSLAYDRKDRALYLSGEAVFTVAPEKDKPFSVNANGFSTIALGTSFMVATNSSDAIRVRLYSGKVVIRHTGAVAGLPGSLSGEGAGTGTDAGRGSDGRAEAHAGAGSYSGSGAGAIRDVYLQPGEEGVYTNHVHQMLVSRFEPADMKTGLALNAKDGLQAQRGLRGLRGLRGRMRKDIRHSGDTLIFDNAPLADVLDLLSRRYHVIIQYNRKILTDVYFSGQALPGDAIELLLKTVTRINNLTLTAAGDGFIIK